MNILISLIKLGDITAEAFLDEIVDKGIQQAMGIAIHGYGCIGDERSKRMLFQILKRSNNAYHWIFIAKELSRFNESQTALKYCMLIVEKVEFQLTAYELFTNKKYILKFPDKYGKMVPDSLAHKYTIELRGELWFKNWGAYEARIIKSLLSNLDTEEAKKSININEDPLKIGALNWLLTLRDAESVLE